MKKEKAFWSIAVLIVVLDQITKILLTNVHFGIINFVTNTGAAFSLFKGGVVYLSIISIFVILFIIYYFKKNTKLYLPLAFLLGGATGNLIDRLFLGHVRDFVDLKFWPVFNVADSFNVIGVIIIAYLVFRRKV